MPVTCCNSRLPVMGSVVWFPTRHNTLVVPVGYSSCKTAPLLVDWLFRSHVFRQWQINYETLSLFPLCYKMSWYALLTELDLRNPRPSFEFQPSSHPDFFFLTIFLPSLPPLPSCLTLSCPYLFFLFLCSFLPSYKPFLLFFLNLVNNNNWSLLMLCSSCVFQDPESPVWLYIWLDHAETESSPAGGLLRGPGPTGTNPHRQANWQTQA